MVHTKKILNGEYLIDKKKMFSRAYIDVPVNMTRVHQLATLK